jgi:predicted permease
MQKLVFSLSIITMGLVIGYISQRLALAGKIKADASLTKQRKILQRVVLLCLNPIATIGAIWILSFDNVRITLMPAIGILAMITGGLAALVIGKLIRLKPRQQGAFLSCGAMSNVGSIGALLVSSVPGRIVTFSTKIGILGPWKRDLAIRGTRKNCHIFHTV